MVATLMKPQIRLKVVVNCIRCIVRLRRALNTQDFDTLGEFGRRLIARMRRKRLEAAQEQLIELESRMSQTNGLQKQLTDSSQVTDSLDLNTFLLSI